ncbi:sigma-54 interaction domain-containing protein [Desulfosarcina ovata]|uniref:Fis family transcriptional regulator n=2 Tax=Desulfosarcina ovata TaxID=83564 RepID=A0A5K8A5V2_9BACT|nr:sigma 54-interacting transcriptional regulator [Desulfosarcina ovata]BBO80693.1 Fis family transcriptional regulator [Desulfosarcina ovata subsp. sediminis]BBO87905.1 Fis family transcriptional regulator [Desulfosarcina ovata subsp. ovata]
MKTHKPDPIPHNVTEIILESISDGVFTVDHAWRIMSFNRAAEEITGIRREEAIGRHCWEVFRANMCEDNCALKRTMQDGTALTNTSTYIVNSQKKRIPISVSTAPLISSSGEILGGVETFRDHSVVEALRKRLYGRFQIGDIVSRNDAMHEILAILPMVAESGSTVLLEGETGTGKELLARAIHNASSRKEMPFVAINCSALPDSLLESELFGYKAGAFTNATRDKPGYFDISKGGTILLDEIGETSPAFQVKLLRVLEEQAVAPLGSVRKIKTDVRVIAATNKNLSDLVADGKFRQDLFYRINVVRMVLPPLRNRKEDIPLLVEHFIEKMNMLRGKAITGVDADVLQVLMCHDYPGNIRELENIIEHAFVLCASGPIQVSHLPGNFSGGLPPSHERTPLSHTLNTTEAIAIVNALKRHDYNRMAAAKALGMHKSTLFRKIKKLGIPLPEIDGRSRSERKKTPT